MMPAAARSALFHAMAAAPALAFALAAGAAQAAPLPGAARAEVEALLERLETSGCQFGRNGNWYGGAEAKAHLLRKLAYLERKDLVRSAEQFIERGASASSASGKPYLVRCGQGAAVASGSWLGAELQAIRAR